MIGALQSKRWLVVAIVGLALIVMWGRQIDDGPIISDAGQSLQMGLNLERHGTLSLEQTAPFTPTDFREPLVPMVTAVAIGIEDLALGRAPPEAYFSGQRLRFLKYQNILWLGLLSISAFWAARTLTASFWAGLAAVIVINLSFRPHFPPGLIDDLMNEIPAAAILVPASTAFAIAVMRRNARLILLAGILFGLLSLIKAMALYVFAAMAVILLGASVLQRSTLTPRIAARDLALFALSFACIVGPWILRNWIQLRTTEITERASFALQERYYEDQMSAEEMKGAIYWWAPVFKDRIGAQLGFSADDLLPGGRLQRLNDDPDSATSQLDRPYEAAGAPEKAVTFYRRARAEVWRVVMLYQRQGHPFPQVAAEAAVKKQALTGIETLIGRHLAVTPLFLWRGATRSAPILLAALALGAWYRRWELVLFVTPALMFTAAYALTSPYFPRYDSAMHLLALVTLPILAVLFYRDIAGRRSQPR